MSAPTLLKYSYYRPARGGHAPGDLRDAFAEALEEFEALKEGEPLPTVEVRDQEISLARLCGLLWNCTDIMPSGMCWMVQCCGVDDFLVGSTYATGARQLKELIRSASLAN